MPTFIGDELIFPDDPLGRHGPRSAKLFLIINILIVIRITQFFKTIIFILKLKINVKISDKCVITLSTANIIHSSKDFFVFNSSPLQIFIITNFCFRQKENITVRMNILIYKRENIFLIQLWCKRKMLYKYFLCQKYCIEKILKYASLTKLYNAGTKFGTENQKGFFQAKS